MNQREIEALYGPGTHANTNPCDICSFGCPVQSVVRAGKMIAVSPDTDDPVSRGFLCAKGYASRQYVYRPDRIKTPLRRVGERGEGRFEPISWDEALGEIARRLNDYKARFGTDSVAFYSGYTKWYRPFLHRLAHSFGTLNYGTESSTCFHATTVANKCASGLMTNPDAAHAGILIGWSYNTPYSNLPMPDLDRQRKRGAKIIIVDPKLTPAAARADVHLRPRPGTDGALALGMAREFIRRGLTDDGFIGQHVLGYEAFRQYAEGFDPERVRAITGIAPEMLLAAVDLIENNGPMCIVEGNAGMIHHTNGVQAYRAVNALIAITGGYVKKGGSKAVPAGDVTASVILREEAFINQHRPSGTKPKIGSEKYPLWSVCLDEYQSMELARQITTGEPYPVKALFALGMNARMFPNDKTVFDALKQVDFFAEADIFMSDTAKYADILLPACTCFERDELRSVGRWALYYKKAIAPLYESRSDTDILCGLAKALGLEDALLTKGYDACCEFLAKDLDVSLEQLKKTGSHRVPSEPGGDGLRFLTSSGKYELCSSLAEKYGYEPLPKYTDPYDDADVKQYPLILCSGGRLPNAFASRFHGIPWARELRKAAALDISPDTAQGLGIEQGDLVRLSTTAGCLTLPANITKLCLDGVVNLYHGYSEADVNALIPPGHHDPLSGFPGFRSVRCRVELAEKKTAGAPGPAAYADGSLAFSMENCTGCGACAVACMDRCDTDLSRRKPLRRLTEVLEGPELRFSMWACVHCEQPDCVSACPAGAITKDNFGLVGINMEQCVGCLSCVEACKNSAIFVNLEQKPYKCDGCHDRAALALPPKCVEACRFGALSFKITSVAAVILTGGRSSRMGRDKSRLPIGDTTFAQKLVRSFSEHFKDVYISAAPGSDMKIESTKLIFDEKEGLGPLSGLLAAFKQTAAEAVFICATDMPWADPKLAVFLVGKLDGHDACVIRRRDGRLETAFAVYSKRCLPALADVLENGRRSFMELLNKIDVTVLDEDALAGFDIDRILQNVNTPEEYNELVGARF